MKRGRGFPDAEFDPDSDALELAQAADLRKADAPINRGRPAAGSLPAIDGLSRKIIKMLQDDGRTSYATIARRLGVSEGTVRARVNQMRRDNVFRLVAVVNPLALGYTAWAMLGIRVASAVEPARVAAYFRDRPEVVYTMRVAARYDILVEVVCEDPYALRRFLDEHCYRSPDIASVEPMIGLGLYKSLFKWQWE